MHHWFNDGNDPHKLFVKTCPLSKGVDIVVGLSSDIPIDTDPQGVIIDDGHVIWRFQNRTRRNVPIILFAKYFRQRIKWSSPVYTETPDTVRLTTNVPPREDNKGHITPGRCDDSEPVNVKTNGIEHIATWLHNGKSEIKIQFSARKEITKKQHKVGSTRAKKETRMKSTAKVILESLKTLPIVAPGAAAIKAIIDEKDSRKLTDMISTLLDSSDEINNNILITQLDLKDVSSNHELQLDAIAKAVEEVRNHVINDDSVSIARQFRMNLLDDYLVNLISNIFSGEDLRGTLKSDFEGHFNLEVNGKTDVLLARNVVKLLQNQNQKKISIFFEQTLIKYGERHADELRDVLQYIVKK